MPLILTLVASATDPISEALDHLAEAGLRPKPGAAHGRETLHARDVEFAHDPGRTAIAAILAPLALDWALQPAAGRRKKLLLADMDSTIITVECLDELADFAGRKAEIAAITEEAMQGRLEFEPALRARVAMLAGLSERALADCFAERVALNPGARMLVRTMAEGGAHCALISGGFTFFTARVAALAGFHVHRGNQFLLADGRLTGEVAEPILGRAAKRAALREFVRNLGITAAGAMAIGDGANDCDMVAEAGLGLAYHAKPALASVASGQIRHTDLTAALFFQGYRATDFVAD